MNRGFFAVLAFVLGLAAAFAPTPVLAKEGLIKIRVCNNSNDVALVAISYIPVGESRFYNRGWFPYEPGECAILVGTDNATFYGYADADGTDRYWGGDHSLCVEYPGPYNFYTGTSGYCETWQDVREFVVMKAKEPGVFTWNLNP
jgi:uncharacterized membrane protein